MLLPRAILPLLIAAAVAAIIVHFARAYISPAEDAEDNRRALRESVFCFLAAVVACFAWNIIAPFGDRWMYMFGDTTGISPENSGMRMGNVPVDTSIPDW